MNKTMTLAEIQEAVFNIIADELGADLSVITLETTLDELKADSLHLIEAELRLGEYFEVDAVLDFGGEAMLGDIVNAIEAALRKAATNGTPFYPVGPRVIAIIAKQRGLSSRTVRSELVLMSDLGVYDIDYALIVAGLAEEFRIKLDTMSSLMTVQQVVELVRAEVAKS